MAHFLIINTGGTIGMVSGARGLEPKAGEIESALLSMPVLQPWLEHQITWEHWQPLLDSSDLTPKHWYQLRETIRHHPDTDGVLIIHGTDTLSYSAAALSYLLADTNKPIVITGAMQPISAEHSDAPANLLLSLKGLLSTRKEVMVAVGQHLLPGSKVTKLSTEQDNSFYAPGWQDSDWSVAFCSTPFLHQPDWRSTAIGVVTLYPGMPLDGLMSMVDRYYRAIVIQAFGNGNAHYDDAFRRILERAQEMRIPVFVRSQCLNGHVSFDKYAAGALFQDCAAISCGKMTLEAVVTKLQILGSAYNRVEDVVRLFRTPISREWQ